MQKNAGLFIIVFTLTATLMVLQPTAAQNNILTVPDEFPMITQAIQNATHGDTIFIKTGTYNETLVIDKAITLKGEDTNRTIINGNCSGTVILIRYSSVTVTGLTIAYNSTPNSPRTYWVHNMPKNFFGFSAEWDSSYYPTDSGYFTRYGEWRLAGIHIQNAYYCKVIGNRILDCGLGVWLYQSDNNIIQGNEFLRNDYGILLHYASDNNITQNTFENGGGGVWFSPSRTHNKGFTHNPSITGNVFAQNNFIGNQKPYENQFLFTTQNSWDDGAHGNYWSNYNGTDSNQDGVGDTPYQIVGEHYTGGWNKKGEWVNTSIGEDSYPLMKPFDTSSMFVVSPENESAQLATDLTLIEAAASVIGITAIVALVVWSKKRKGAF